MFIKETVSKAEAVFYAQIASKTVVANAVRQS
jgi:hypothetical protein